MVNSITKVVQNLIDNDPALKDSLQRNYANFSAVARLLKPSVEKILDKSINLESLVTSVKRAKVDYRLLQGKINRIIAESVIHLRTNMSKISLERSERTLKTVRKILSECPQDFFQVFEGISSITLIFDQKIFSRVYKLFKDDNILDIKRNLAEIIINSPKEIIDTPGCALAFYNPISIRQVNIEETMSCFTDTIIVLSIKDVGNAFIILTDLIAEARSRE